MFHFVCNTNMIVLYMEPYTQNITFYVLYHIWKKINFIHTAFKEFEYKVKC